MICCRVSSRSSPATGAPCPVAVRSADGRSPGDHDVPRGSASPPSPVASTSSTNVTASHASSGPASGLTTRASGDRTREPPGPGPHRAGEDRAADEQRHRLAGDERVAEQRGRDRQPGAPQHEHHGARERPEQVPGRARRAAGRRRTTCGRAPAAGRPAALAASEPLRSSQTSEQRGRPSRTRGTPRRRRRTAARRRRAGSRAGPFGERRAALLGRQRRQAGARAGPAPSTVWCSVSSSASRRAGRASRPGSTSVGRRVRRGAQRRRTASSSVRHRRRRRGGTWSGATCGRSQPRIASQRRPVLGLGVERLGEQLAQRLGDARTGRARRGGPGP